MNENIERLLDGTVDVTWPVFLHIMPIIERFLESEGRQILSIDDIFSKNGRVSGSSAQNTREEAELRIAEKLDGYLFAAVPHMHAVARCFESCIKLDANRQPQVNFHTAVNQHDFYIMLAEHFSQIIKYGSGIDIHTKKEMENVVNFFEKAVKRNGFMYQRSVHIGFEHGSHAIDFTKQRYPVVFDVVRIKYNLRWAKKIARVICQGLMEYEHLKKVLNHSQQPRTLPKYIIETLGGMHFFELPTPFGEGALYAAQPNPLEYLLVRSRVSDAVGVFYVTRTREEAMNLLQRMIDGNFNGSNNYQVLEGQILERGKEKWRYKEGFIIDNHFKTGSSEETGGNLNVFFYVIPNMQHPSFDIRVDVGISDLFGYARDCPPNKGSHTLYEQRQQEKIRKWSLPYRRLYHFISRAVLSVMERLDVYKYPLTPDFTAQQSGRIGCVNREKNLTIPAIIH